MEIREHELGIEVSTATYRLLLHRHGGYAVREVEISGEGRLDRFDRPGEGPHPTCMYFDNLTVNYTHQLAYYGKMNTNVSAAVEDAAVQLKGHLIPIEDNARGQVYLEKTMRFQDDLYDVDLSIAFEDTGHIDYLSIWWDVNDKWLRAMRSSAGVFMPLRVGVGDAFDEYLSGTWRPMPDMERGAGVWIEMIGQHASIMSALTAPSPKTLKAGGMKYWDGPDDADEGDGVSHGCINLDVINCELSGAQPLDIKTLDISYRVFLSGPTVLRKI